MATVSAILHRFRFHGVPGAPTSFAVPIDRTAVLDAELSPVFSLLETDQTKARETVDDAHQQAARRRATATQQAQAILADASARTDALRADAAAHVFSRATHERVEMIAAARREAERIDRVAAERLPTLVHLIVSDVLEFGKS